MTYIWGRVYETEEPFVPTCVARLAVDVKLWRKEKVCPVDDGFVHLKLIRLDKTSSYLNKERD